MDHFSQLPTRNSQVAGFTRLDLLAIIVAVGVLSLLATAAKATGDTSSEMLTCIRNQKQLIRAWQLYAEDNDGRLAQNLGINSTSTTINWAYSSINFNFNEYNWKSNYVLDPKFASLGPYAKEAQFFRCPSDRSRFSVQGMTLPRVRSFSMNYYIGKVTDNFFPSGGMRFYARLSDLVKPQPTQHFVFMDTHPDSLSNSDFHIDAAVRGRGQWYEYPASFHQSGASMGFADGRAEVHIWSESSTKIPVRYDGSLFGGAFSSSRDYAWIAERASGGVN